MCEGFTIFVHYLLVLLLLRKLPLLILLAKSATATTWFTVAVKCFHKVVQFTCISGAKRGFRAVLSFIILLSTTEPSN